MFRLSDGTEQVSIKAPLDELTNELNNYISDNASKGVFISVEKVIGLNTIVENEEYLMVETLLVRKYKAVDYIDVFITKCLQYKVLGNEIYFHNIETVLKDFSIFSVSSDEARIKETHGVLIETIANTINPGIYLFYSREDIVDKIVKSIISTFHISFTY